MAADTSTVAWIGAGGVIVGAAVGAVSGWASAAIGSSQARRDARDDRRRAAYAAFLVALDEILGIYTLLTWDKFEARLDSDPKFHESFSQALGSVNHTCVGVILVGSQEAHREVKGIEEREMESRQRALGSAGRRPANCNAGVRQCERELR